MQLALSKKKQGPPTFACEYAMKVIRWTDFERLSSLVRSDTAAARGLIVETSQDQSVVFISHTWWHRPPAPEQPAPDFPSGDEKDLKFRVICTGMRALIAHEGLDPSKVALWCDWFSIDQDDKTLKAAGVKSMIHYATRCSHMLIPVPTAAVVSGEFKDGMDPDDCSAYYPEDVADYGERGWVSLAHPSHLAPPRPPRTPAPPAPPTPPLRAVRSLLTSDVGTLTVPGRVFHLQPLVRDGGGGGGRASAALRLW